MAFLLIVAGAAAAPIEPRWPAELEVFHCDFGEEQWDKNFDQWPDGWVRERGRGFPSYLNVKLSKEDVPETGRGAGFQLAATGGACLVMELDGGAAAISSPPVPVSSIYAYVVEALVKTEGLEHDRAFLSLTLLDERRGRLARVYSEKVRDTGGWGKLRLGPVAADPPGARFAVIGLHLEPQARADLSGSARFADVWMARLPRMSATLNSPTHVFAGPEDVRVVCEASGFTSRGCAAEFELYDESGKLVARDRQTLTAVPAAEAAPGPEGAGEGGPPMQGSAAWTPPLEGPGFFRVAVTLAQTKGRVPKRGLSLAVLPPAPAGGSGEFGWSLPRGERPLPLPVLGQLISQAGINWVKYPLWSGPKTPATDVEQWVAFGERLNTQGIELVGLLARPPRDSDHRLPDEAAQAADVFGPNPDLWYPSIEPAIVRLATRVRWWQLGDDADRSFVGFRDLAGRIAEVKARLDRVGQDVNLGFGWDWMAELPRAPRDAAPWRFLALSTEPPLTHDELGLYLIGAQGAGARRWVSLEPLRRDEYPVEVRAVDLVRRMMAAKMHRADAVFLTDPFDAETGVMQPDGTAGELLLPWRTAALALRGAEYLGSVELPGGSPNHVFARGDEAVMAVWNEKPVRETLYLGPRVRQVDLWGRSKVPPSQKHEQSIEVGPVPTFVTGLSRAVAQWRMEFAFDQARLPSVFGRSHPNAFRLVNRFPQGVSGSAELVMPDAWTVEPRRTSFRLAAGETQNFPFQIVLPYTAANGRHKVRVDFEVQADRPYRFSVYRHVDLGLGDVYIKIGTRTNDRNELEIEQRFVNDTAGRVSFDCQLFVPDRKRLKTQVLGLGPGQDVQVYRLPGGEELAGKTLWLRAVEIGGPRVLNYRFTAHPRGT